MLRILSSRRPARLVVAGAAALTIGVGTGVATAPPALAVNGAVSGVAFQDVDFDGVRDAGGGNLAAEPGIAGVTVTVTDSAGTTVGTAVTATDGTYTVLVTDAATSQVRVVFGLPAGFGDGALGTDSGSTVQFVDLGQEANLGVAQVGQFNDDDNPFVLTTVNRTPGALFNAATTWPALPALVGYLYDQTGRQGDPAWPATQAPTVLATQGQIGTTWGAASYGTNTALTSAYLRRSAPIGPAGTGAIYATDVALAAGGTPNATLLATIPNAGSTGRATETVTNDVSAWADDAQQVTNAYRVGLGDIDVTADRTALYAVNLNDRNLYKVALSPGATPSDAPVAGAPLAIPLPLDLPGAQQGCNPADVHPFGLGEYLGTMYVTLTCTAESTNDPANLRGYVYTMTETAPNTFTFSPAPVIELALNYDRGEGGLNINEPAEPAEWTPWDNQNSTQYDPEPLLSTISFDLAGNASLSIKDRQADKSADDWSAGELLKLCRTGASWALEQNGSCGGDAGAQAGVGYGPGDGLFYESTFSYNGLDRHQQTLLGSSLEIPGFSSVLATSFDPETPGNTNGTNDYERGYGQDGVRTLGHTDGAIANWATLDYVDPNTLAPHVGSFGKAGSIGDLAALIDLAPVEIGNRVWIDSDRDGVQDAGEPPVVGVAVNLYAADGTTLIATAITDANGEYSFSNRTDAGDAAHVRIPTFTDLTDYVVKVDRLSDFTSGALAGYLPTVTAAGPDRSVDSNGVATPVGSVVTSVADAQSPALNTADHTFDFGFVLQEYDLMITKSLVTSGPYTAGSAVTYSLVVRNNGPDTAWTGLTVTDKLPAGLAFTSPAATGTSWDCAGAVGQEVTCTWLGPDLAMGDTTTPITINAVVTPAAPTGVALVNYSVVRPSVDQPNPETIPVGTNPDGYENGSNVPTANDPSNNDDSQPITIDATPEETTTTTTTPETTAPPTTQPTTTEPPTTVPVPTIPELSTIPPEVLPPIVPSTLPVTGGNSNGIMLAALALLAVGAAGFFVARRRRA